MDKRQRGYRGLHLHANLGYHKASVIPTYILDMLFVHFGLVAGRQDNHGHLAMTGALMLHRGGDLLPILDTSFNFRPMYDRGP